MFREVAAVDELDAQILDEELAQLLKKELVHIFPIDIPEWCLHLLIYSKQGQSVGSYGSDMMNLKYLSGSNRMLYLLLKVLIPSAVSINNNKNLVMLAKLFYFMHYILYLIDGKYLYISHRLLGIKAVYKNSLQPRLLHSEFITRQVIWQGLSDFAVFIAPFVNWIKLRNLTRDVRKFKDLPADVCAICLDKGYKSIKITNPYKTNCNHNYCYYCIKSEMMADLSMSCLICKSKIKNITPNLD
jgi:peroxin-2